MHDHLHSRALTVDDIPNVVAVHLSAFSGFFLTTLGKGFLKKYYEAVILHPESICIGCENEKGDLAGFAVGNRLSKGFHVKILKKHWLMFMLEGVRVAVVKPKAIVRLYRNLNKNSNTIDDGLYAELLSLGVHGSVEGKGIGKYLVGQFEQAARESGALRICLTTDKFENERTIAFYQKRGYQTYYEFTTYPNRLMYKLIKYIV